MASLRELAPGLHQLALDPIQGVNCYLLGDVLVDADFYRFEHRLVYGAIGKLVAESKPADVITVFEQLQSLGKAEECGGLAYLNALAQSVPSAANIRRYAEIVRERAILRKLVAASDEIATTAFNPQGKAVATILDEAEQKIFNIGEEGSRLKQGFQTMDAWSCSCSTGCRRWRTTPTTSPACPPASTTSTA